MTLYRKLSRNPKQFLTVTGMNLHQFQELLPKFTQALKPSKKIKVFKQSAKRSVNIGSLYMPTAAFKEWKTWTCRWHQYWSTEPDVIILWLVTRSSWIVCAVRPASELSTHYQDARSTLSHRRSIAIEMKTTMPRWTSCRGWSTYEPSTESFKEQGWQSKLNYQGNAMSWLRPVLSRNMSTIIK